MIAHYASYCQISKPTNINKIFTILRKSAAKRELLTVKIRTPIGDRSIAA